MGKVTLGACLRLHYICLTSDIVPDEQRDRAGKIDRLADIHSCEHLE